MGIVLGSFGAFQGNIWSVAPFIPVGPSEKVRVEFVLEQREGKLVNPIGCGGGLEEPPLSYKWGSSKNA